MGNLQQFIPMLLILVAFYFLMIITQITKQKKEKKFQENLKPGRRVVTTSGIHGHIFSIAEDGVIIETLSGKLKMELAAISRDLTLSRFPEDSEEKK